MAPLVLVFFLFDPRNLRMESGTGTWDPQNHRFLLHKRLHDMDMQNCRTSTFVRFQHHTIHIWEILGASRNPKFWWVKAPVLRWVNS